MIWIANASRASSMSVGYVSMPSLKRVDTNKVEHSEGTNISEVVRCANTQFPDGF